MLKGGIDPGNPYKYRAPSSLLEHLEGDGAGCSNSGSFRVVWET